MSLCSSLGVPLNYSNYPAAINETFYYQNPNNESPYEDIQNQTYAQLFQLNATGLLPASWSNTEQSAMGAEGCVTAGSNGWYKYAPTASGFERYIRSTGSNRIQQMTRNSAGRVAGVPNLLRTNAPVPLSTIGSPWFNDSSLRLDIKDAVGCGPLPGPDSF
jgi:hypothetical protein